MKIKLIYIFLLVFTFTINAYSKDNCSELDKLSKEYAKCIKKKIDDSVKDAGIKKKYKKFKKSKTLVDFFN
tara:strand:- start:132 stop:344 length:213 start_codon:yes stop_codon:yes gene_type:complete